MAVIDLTNGTTSANGVNGSNGIAASKTPFRPKKSILHRNVHHEPTTVLSARGSKYHTKEGGDIFDACGGAAVAAIGHGNTRVTDAMNKQIDKLTYTHSLFFGTEAGESLGKWLLDSTDGKMSITSIHSTGSDAMEASMKLGRQYFLELSPPQPGRVRFIARRQSYHGATLGALSLSGHLARRKPFEPLLLPNVSHVSPCNPYRDMKDGETVEAYVDRLAQELDDEFVRVGPDSVIAFVAEPVVGAALGCMPAVPGYFAAMKKVCDKYGALLILDEVMCGMGRAGTVHAWQQEGVVPDIQAIGKGLGGGYMPVAGLLIGHKVIDTLSRGTGAFAHGQTYQDFPLACATAFEVQNVIQEENLIENVQKMGALLERELKEKLATHPNVGDIRGKGLFWGIELVRDKSTKEPFKPESKVAERIWQKALEAPYNFSLYYGTGSVDSFRGDHIMLSPAFNVTEDDVRYIAETTANVIQDFLDNDF